MGDGLVPICINRKAAALQAISDKESREESFSVGAINILKMDRMIIAMSSDRVLRYFLSAIK